MSLNSSVITGKCSGCVAYKEKVARLEDALVVEKNRAVALKQARCELYGIEPVKPCEAQEREDAATEAIDELSTEKSNLSKRLQQAQEELAKADRSTIYWQEEGQKAADERDVAIERHHQDAGRAWEMYLIAAMVNDIVYGRQLAAERDAAEQRALAERLHQQRFRLYATIELLEAEVTMPHASFHSWLARLRIGIASWVLGKRLWCALSKEMRTLYALAPAKAQEEGEWGRTLKKH